MGQKLLGDVEAGDVRDLKLPAVLSSATLLSTRCVMGRVPAPTPKLMAVSTECVQSWTTGERS